MRRKIRSPVAPFSRFFGFKFPSYRNQPPPKKKKKKGALAIVRLLGYQGNACTGCSPGLHENSGNMLLQATAGRRWAPRAQKAGAQAKEMPAPQNQGVHPLWDAAEMLGRPVWYPLAPFFVLLCSRFSFSSSQPEKGVTLTAMPLLGQKGSFSSSRDI